MTGRAYNVQARDTIWAVWLDNNRKLAHGWAAVTHVDSDGRDVVLTLYVHGDDPHQRTSLPWDAPVVVAQV